MATLYISEYLSASAVAHGLIAGEPIARQKVTVAGTSAQSAALNERTQIVRIVADVPVQWEAGSDPTADANSDYSPADVVEYFHAKPGDKIAVIEKQ